MAASQGIEGLLWMARCLHVQSLQQQLDLARVPIIACLPGFHRGT